MGASDRYCLRWNNHQTNFISVMDDLLKNQTLTDVTLGVEDGRFLKCHKIILATCSPYFRSLFIEVPSNHPIVLLKDVKYTEIKAILEFMYKGEVSVAHDDMAALFQVAELLQVKGLVACNELSSANEPITSPSPTVCSTSSNRNGESAQTSDNFRSTSGRRHSTNLPYGPNIKAPINQDAAEAKYPIPAWPMSQVFPPDDQKPMIPNLANFNPFLPTQFPFSQLCDNLSGNIPTTQSETPILRSVLNPENDDASMRIPVIRKNSRDSQNRKRNSGSVNNESNDRRHSMDSSQSQRAQSPYDNDASIMEEEDRRVIPQTFSEDTKYGVASYGASQKQEIKRYKKYSRKDIWNAIAAVKGGLSANKAAELFSVPSRTLYDKIKKLGIPPIKHRRSENIGISPSLQYDIGGSMSNVGSENILKSTNDDVSEPIENPATLVETTFNETREKSTDPEDSVEVSRKSPSSQAYQDNSQPRSPDETQFKDNETEAEDLTVSRRSNVHVIVSPNNAIQETA